MEMAVGNLDSSGIRELRLIGRQHMCTPIKPITDSSVKRD